MLDVVVFGKVITTIVAMGSTIAIVGVLMYSLAKAKIKKPKKA